MTFDPLPATTTDTTGTTPAVESGRHLATQTQYPWRTAVRSGVGVLLLFLIAAAAASPVIGPWVDHYVPGAGAGVIGFGVFCGSLALLIKRVGAIPAVAALFVRLGVGVVPKSALKS